MIHIFQSFFKVFLLPFVLFTVSIGVKAQSSTNPFGERDPWQKRQLIEPSDLVKMINSNTGRKPLIFNIGVVEDIKGAKNMGAAGEKENLERFKKVLNGLPKSATIVVYCGCCPFNRCPNIRPAFLYLVNNGYVNAKLLNLPTNIKVDWINKGYPLESQSK